MGFAEEQGIKWLAFDIDGTLYPRSQMNWRLVKGALPDLAFSLRFNSMRQEIRRIDGTERSEITSLEDLLRRECVVMYGSEEKLPKFLKKAESQDRRWERLFSDIKPYEGLEETLEAAYGRYRLAALTDFPLFKKLEALGVDKYFSYKASTNDSGAFKPAPAPFLYMLQGLGAPPEQVLYVGDSESKDIKGAKRVGMRAALISPSSGKVYSEADVVFRSWAEFRELIL